MWPRFIRRTCAAPATVGAPVLREHGVKTLSRRGDGWHVDVGRQVLRCRTVVNAAGAWADEVATMAGVRPVGLQPYRRTVFTFASRIGSAGWALVIAADESFYFKPEGADQILASPADESPLQPCDAKPREIDVAAGMEAVNRATLLDVRSIRAAWAGLRTFAPDRAPVVGFDRDAAGFFWCAGQGGTGIQTSPAMALLTADLVSGKTPQGVLEHLQHTDLRQVKPNCHNIGSHRGPPG